jgi:RNA recognition motif-containing protein
MNIDITRTLFVGDLSVFCTEPQLRQLFQQYGIIDDIRLKKTTANETRLGYGFIQFIDRENAQNAMQNLNGMMFHGRVMRINWATPKSSSKKLIIKPPKKAEAAQVHVSFISRQVRVLSCWLTVVPKTICLYRLIFLSRKPFYGNYSVYVVKSLM